MKRVMMMAVTAIGLLTAGAATAQRYDYPSPQRPTYNNPYPQQPGYGRQEYNYDFSDEHFEEHLDWWDRNLNLSRRQERQLRRIHESYDNQRFNMRDPRQRDAFRDMQRRKFYDMMAVLTPNQRAIVVERLRPYERRGRGYDRGPYYGRRY
ncbi:hypothetical protein BN8_04213 [Fibrisoma limi BUZ 3]|uniref:Uncharacterized protein n=1 Tax=Fibrisoma limi BUZ 3 TaxID=1185876 RepID=I2GM59_9BACT|nr:hypothetical protein [Fibrisoma limi]CCH54985.1 hypothetical protein BN8_04213 [Fibrisoma limi BUZ 3]